MSIILEHITITIKKTKILQDVTLQFSEGQIYGIVGKNGSGKTMLLKIISGLVKPTSGQVQNDYENIGILIENAEMYPYFTGYENLEYLASIKGKITGEQIVQTMTKLGLNAEDGKKVCEYSLGMKQKLALSQALMEDPDVLLLDEPTNALDAGSVKSAHDMIKKAASQGKIVAVTSHSPYDIEYLCDWLIFMEEGKVVRMEKNSKRKRVDAYATEDLQ